MDKHERDPAGRLDALCRSAVQDYRLDAFGKVDIDAFVAKDRLSGDDARWIARHLMANARSMSGYQAGQALLAAASNAG